MATVAPTRARMVEERILKDGWMMVVRLLRFEVRVLFTFFEKVWSTCTWDGVDRVD